MKNNPIGYLSVLGLIGVIGLLLGNSWLATFGGFFSFAIAFSDRYDERTERNVNRACRNAFILVVFGYNIVTAIASYLITVEPYSEAFAFFPLGITLVYGLAFLAFISSYYYYRRTGD